VPSGIVSMHSKTHRFVEPVVRVVKYELWLVLGLCTAAALLFAFEVYVATRPIFAPPLGSYGSPGGTGTGAGRSSDSGAGGSAVELSGGVSSSSPPPGSPAKPRLAAPAGSPGSAGEEGNAPPPPPQATARRGGGAGGGSGARDGDDNDGGEGGDVDEAAGDAFGLSGTAWGWEEGTRM